MGDITALVGATGGAGTTRLTVEVAATLARDGEAVAVLGAAYATQGLADHVQGRIDPDVTALVTEERPLDDGLRELPAAAPGRIAVAPAYAPFERLARAKTPEAARQFERLAETAAGEFDAVLLDTPPVAANQSVAAATVADRVALVTPGTTRGTDALARMRDRLSDLGCEVDTTIATRADDTDAAAVAIPESSTTEPGSVPVCDTGEGAFAAAVAEATEAALDRSLDVAFDSRLFGL